MLTARGTLGVALDAWVEPAEQRLRTAAEAGAGAVRVPWSEEGGSAWEPLPTPAFEVIAACPATVLAETWERGRPARITDASILELEVITEGDRAALPAVLERMRERAILLGLGPVSLVGPPAPTVPGDLAPERVSALAVTVEGTPETADPKRMEEALRAVAAPLRAAGWRQPFWLSGLAAPKGTAGEEQAGWLVRHAAHALALAMPRVFLRLPEADPEPALQALRMLSAWLEGAERVTWLARGQYRAEFINCPNRYLIWAEPGITRLPSSFQGPLAARDLAGQVRRVETSHLKPGELPLMVERPGER
jgi:hypothetical protein